MTTKKTSRLATAEKIAALIRIFRSAVLSGDVELKRATETELAVYGIRSSDLAVADVSVPRNGGAA